MKVLKCLIPWCGATTSALNLAKRLYVVYVCMYVCVDVLVLCFRNAINMYTYDCVYRFVEAVAWPELHEGIYRGISQH